MVFPVCEGEGRAASHADVGIGPLWGLVPLSVRVSCAEAGQKAYRAAVEHTAGDVDSRWKPEAFSLKVAVDLDDVVEADAALGSGCPRLYELQHLVLDVVIRSHCRGRPQQRRQIIHKVFGGYLGKKVRAAVLHTGVGELA